MVFKTVLAFGNKLSNNKSDKQFSLTSSIARLLFLAFATVLIMAGTGERFSIASVPLGKALFSAFALSTFVFYISKGAPNWEVNFLSLTLFAIFFLFWGLCVPWTTHGNITYAIQDSTPLIAVLVFFMSNKLMVSNENWRKGSNYIVYVAWAFALIHISLFLLWLLLPSAASMLLDLLKTLMEVANYEREKVVLIDFENEGILRAYFASSSLLFIGILALRDLRSRTRLSYLIVITIGAAFLSTLTRSFMLGYLGSLAVFFALRRMFSSGKPSFFAVYLLIIFPIALSPLFLMSLDPQLLELLGLSRADSDSVRWSQLDEMLAAIQESPVVGHGFGASLPTVRDEEAPFAYELMTLALVMKLGLFGVAIAVGLVSFMIYQISPYRWPDNARSTYASYFGYMIACIFNPYLFGFFGTFFVLVLLYEYSSGVQK